MFGLDLKKVGIFAGGVLFGTAGLSILGSRDAKKVYTHTAAAVLRGKECLEKRAALVRENCDDILADARAINDDRRAAEGEIIEDSAE